MKKVLIGFFMGMMFCITINAAIVLSSDKVGYKDATVKNSLDDLFTQSVDGKNSITTALSNKGFNVTNDSTYSDIVNGINELPITIEKDNDGNWGYIKEGEDTITPFSGGQKIIDLGSNKSYDIKTLAPEVDYTKLTISNFIIADLSPAIGTISASQSGYPNAYTGYGYASVSRTLSYNASTGVLTAYTTLNVQGSISDAPYTQPGTNSASANSHAYLIIG